MSNIEGDLLVEGHLSCGSLSPPASSVTDAAIAAASAGNEVAASKLEHRHVIIESWPDGADVASTGGDGIPIFIVRGVSGTIRAVEASMSDPPTGGTDNVTVDIYKASDGVAAVTVLTAPISFDDDNNYVVKAGSISVPALADGETLIVKVVKGGSAGTAGQGLVVQVTLDEDAS